MSKGDEGEKTGWKKFYPGVLESNQSNLKAHFPQEKRYREYRCHNAKGEIDREAFYQILRQQPKQQPIYKLKRPLEFEYVWSKDTKCIEQYLLIEAVKKEGLLTDELIEEVRAKAKKVTSQRSTVYVAPELKTWSKTVTHEMILSIIEKLPFMAFLLTFRFSHALFVQDPFYAAYSLALVAYIQYR